MIFPHVFLLILLNIGLYAYIVRYRSEIKIPGFHRNVSKNFQNKFKNFQKKILNILN
jgi:hypothetical protein